MRRISLFSAVATIYQMLEILPRLGGGGYFWGFWAEDPTPTPIQKIIFYPFVMGCWGSSRDP